MTRRALSAALAVTTLAFTGCSVPRFEGPQIQEPPLGFFLQPETVSPRRMFPDHDVSFQTTWVHTDLSGVSVIYIHGHPGVLDVDDMALALDGAMRAATDPDKQFGNIERLTIDGRAAYGWSERIESDRRGLVDAAYRVMIPYDTITYTIEFESGEPNWKMGAPDTMRAVISSFGIGATTWNIPLIAILAGGGLLGISGLRARAQKRSQQIRGINLVTIPKDEKDGETAEKSVDRKEEETAERGATAAAAPAPPGSPGTPAAPSPAAVPPPPVNPTELSSRSRPPGGEGGSA